MPMLDSFFNKIHEKFEELKISDINHELGKAKNSLVHESRSYVSNLKNDAALVSTLVRSESTKFSNYVGTFNPSLPKSTSVPALSVFSGKRSSAAESEAPGKSHDSSAKYRYKSSSSALASPVDERFDSAKKAGNEEFRRAQVEDIVNRFIRVVGASESASPRRSPRRLSTNNRSRKLVSREDIRKKLAFGPAGDCGTLTNKNPFPSVYNNASQEGDLSICFINEVASEDEGSEAEDDAAYRPREDPCPEARYAEEKRRLQKDAGVALAGCKLLARSQCKVERQERKRRRSLERLIGVESINFNEKSLWQLNVAQLQVFTNYLHTQIESHNGLLVDSLMDRDELIREQDSMLVDIEDISKKV